MPTSEVKVPDIGDFKDVLIIEVHVKPGDTVKAEDPLLTLESDKATVDVPSPRAGKVRDIKVKVGERVSEGHVIAVLDDAGDGARAGTPAAAPEPAAPAQSRPAPPPAAPPPAAATAPPAPATPPPAPAAPPPAPAAPSAAPAAPAPAAPRAHEDAAAEPHAIAHASPSVRRFARELGVDLSHLNGSGPHRRILKQDIEHFVKDSMTRQSGGAAGGANGAGLNLIPWPQIDFTKFGPIETRPLSRIKKLAGANLARNWVMIPHVTQHDEADVTDLEAFRVELNKENEKAGIKVTFLAFLIKACVATLQRYPEFNASLAGDDLVYKKYFNIGFAADTPGGLVVPVLTGADRKGVIDIARETAELAARAREGKLAVTEMQGGCFTISSLGGIGGTAFTPIIQAPEVAILGVSRTAMRPTWNGKDFVPRLILPLSLSYDHRVIDGAAAARFTSYLVKILADLRRTLL